MPSASSSPRPTRQPDPARPAARPSAGRAWRRSTGCAAGDTLTAALAEVLRNPGPTGCPDGIAVGKNPGPQGRLSPSLLVVKQPGPPGCPSGTALVILPAVQGVVRGALVLKDPGPISRTFVIVPGGISGYGLVNPGPQQ